MLRIHENVKSIHENVKNEAVMIDIAMKETNLENDPENEKNQKSEIETERSTTDERRTASIAKITLRPILKKAASRRATTEIIGVEMSAKRV
jgi:hypothetical protein